jgi:hypothetical protein
MARFEIMSRDGLSVRFKGAPKYNGVFGRPSYIEFAEIASPVPIEWQIGDYVDYTRTGFRYTLYSIPQVTKSASRDKAGDGFVYKNVQFYCATKDFELALFRDLVEYDNTIHFSSVPNVDTYEDVYGIARRIQANMDDFASGKWSIKVFNTSDTDVLAELHTVREFSVSDATCLDALNTIYNLWRGIGWIYSYENGVHTITIGRPNVQDAGNTVSEFSYGHGNGLKVIARALSGKNGMATRIYAYGSDRNMPTRYYNNLTPYIKDHESVYIPHLMLPLSDWGTTGGARDARLAYLEDATATAKYGLIPKVLRFDGSGDNEDIYPSLEGMTVGDVADSDFPATGWSSSTPVDEVYVAVNPSDDGQYTEGSERQKQSATVSIPDPDKTYTTIAGQEAVTIANDAALFTTGTALGPGRFVIDMGDLGGSIIVTGGNFSELPRGFLEVYVGDTLETSQELDVIAGYTRVQNEYLFSSSDVAFTTSNNGIVKAYIRFEAKMPSNAPSASLSYNLETTTVKISVEYTIESTFVLKVPQLGFDLNTLGTSTVDGLATLSMKTGMCAGRDFIVKKAEYSTTTHTWDLTCQRQDDTSLMLYFPNSTYEIASGDKYVLVDIQMPSKYVTAAMSRLHDAAMDALARLSKPRMVYTPEVDSKEVYMSEISLMEGLYMPVYDTDLISVTGNTEWVLIDSVTIAENDEPIPVWSVTLRDEKAESMMASLTGELASAKKRLRDWDVDDSRRPARLDTEAVLVPTVVGVTIQAERTFFPYTGDGAAQTLVLTAVTSGINNPTYQWYYLGASDWVAISGATGQAYEVESDSSIYYQDGEVVEDFRVVVTDGSDSWNDRIQVTKLTGSTTVALSNPVHLFAGEVDTAVDGQTDTTTVVAYAGDSLTTATVNSISGTIAGALTATVRAGTNGTTAPIIDIAVTDSLTLANGVLTVSVTAGGVTRSLTYSWAIAFKGEDGSGASIVSVDLDNEMDGIGVGSDGMTSSQVVLQTTASMWHGTTQLTITAITVGTMPSGFSSSVNTSTGVVTITIVANTSVGANVPINITVSGTLDSSTVTRNAVFTVAGIRDGEDGTVYYLLPSVTSVKKDASGTYSVPSVSCTRMKRVGDSSGSTTTDGSLKYSIDGGAETTYSSAISTANFTETLTFFFYVGGVLVDKETVPMLIDGTNGDSIYTAMVYKESDSKPATPTGTTVPPTGWDVTMPSSGDTPITPSYDSNFITSGGKKRLKSIYDNGNIWGKVSFTANAGDVIKVAIRASSEVNYDFGFLSPLDSEAHSTSTYKARVSGTQTAEVEYAIPAAGTHFFCVGYVKDSSQSSGDDTVYVESVAIASQAPIWMSSSIVTNGVSDGNWSEPIKVSGSIGPQGDPGADGYSRATIYMYQRFSTGVPTSYPIGNATYTFETGVLAANSGQTLNGWTTGIPTGDGPIYVTMANVNGNGATASVTGGWTTSGGDWTVPSRLTGDNGLMGKVMRGVNEFSQYGVGTQSNPINYQGRSDIDSTHIYYDVVMYNDTLYYCENEKNEAGTRYARQITPGTDSYVWVEAQDFDFIATKVLMASNAFIDIFSGNAAYMYDNDGPASGDIVAGMQGGSTTIYGGQTVNQVNFFAGDDNPMTAPFRVYSDGSFVSTMGQVGGYTYDDNGLTYYANVTGSSQNGYHCIYQKDSFEIMWRNNGRTNQVIADVQPSANQVMKIEQGFGNKPALVIDGYSGTSVALDVTGDIQRNAESVVTANDLSLTKDPILHIVHCTQSEYDSISSPNANTMYVIE